MSYQVIVPKGSAPPLAPYSPGAKAGNALYVSGTLALDSAGNVIGKGDVKAQTRHILETIKAVLEAAGGSLRDITFNHIFLSDMTGYAAMNEVYREFSRRTRRPDTASAPSSCGRNLGRDCLDRASRRVATCCGN